jgi:gluconate 5-dehydrogenase
MAALPYFDLSGKVAAVSGGATGIGRGIAEGLAEAGASVVVASRRRDSCESAAREIADKTGARTLALALDVIDAGSVDAFIDATTASLGPIDILVNNAGMQYRAPLEEFPADAFERLLQTNIASVFHAGQACARHMIARRRGRIINIASIQSALARPSIAPYTATKGAVSNLTKGMATDWARYGLNCNAIAPGYFDTPLNKALVEDPDFTRWLENRTPQGRWGQLDELVGAAIFLASDAASFVNGITLFVDGGMSASV